VLLSTLAASVQDGWQQQQQQQQGAGGSIPTAQQLMARRARQPARMLQLLLQITHCYAKQQLQGTLLERFMVLLTR
jgi:hypothetical protein